MRPSPSPPLSLWPLPPDQHLPVISDGWCCLDFVVVTASLVQPFLTGDPAPIIVFRLMRAFRILRIFGRIKSIRIIINALSASLLPVMNAFIIMAIMLCLYSIMAVALFADIAPQAFGNLSRSVISLFRIAAGETWVEDVPVLNRGGHVDWALSSFIMSFIV